MTVLPLEPHRPVTDQGFCHSVFQHIVHKQVRSKCALWRSQLLKDITRPLTVRNHEFYVILCPLPCDKNTYGIMLLHFNGLGSKFFMDLCLTFLHCVFSNVLSNCLFQMMHNHIGCICLSFLHCGTLNDSSMHSDQSMHSHTGCICLVFLSLVSHPTCFWKSGGDPV